MKKIISGFIAILIITGFVACNDNKGNTAVTNLENYVDSVGKIDRDYSDDNWAIINTGYETRVSEAEKSDLDADQKAKVEASKSKYETIRTKYVASVEKAKPVVTEVSWKQKIRDNAFGAGKVSDDMSFAYVTADNVADVYNAFVDYTRDNRKEFSIEDWDELKALYEALDAKKESLNKDIKTADNVRIAPRKAEFTGLYKVGRAVAKARATS